MISTRASEYCREDLSLIENYAEAMADKTQVWHVHHRDEIRVLPSGMVARRTLQDLIEAGRYYQCPANELIFVTNAEHHKIHFKGRVGNRLGSRMTPEQKQHMRDVNIGRVMKPEWKAKISARMKGHVVTPQTREKLRQAAFLRAAKNKALKEATNA